jgi:hypothetical protein
MKRDSKKSHGFKEQMRVGREVANMLDPLRSIESVAAEMGISKIYARRLECQALYKVAMRMRQLRDAGELEFPGSDNYAAATPRVMEGDCV